VKPPPFISKHVLVPKTELYIHLYQMYVHVFNKTLTF